MVALLSSGQLEYIYIYINVFLACLERLNVFVKGEMELLLSEVVTTEED